MPRQLANISFSATHFLGKVSQICLFLQPGPFAYKYQRQAQVTSSSSSVFSGYSHIYKADLHVSETRTGVCFYSYQERSHKN